jgi:hypothetical protein
METVVRGHFAGRDARNTAIGGVVLIRPLATIAMRIIVNTIVRLVRALAAKPAVRMATTPHIGLQGNQITNAVIVMQGTIFQAIHALPILVASGLEPAV